ncbi:transglycosylase SLT domain-containing protein [Nocardioides jensenii]|uniref:transglycosylase SLT domain-containing protein n=1 Tax=Nocardioides jensenii TaxID=1843 RepID=UPI00082AAFD5|nr:transglycosylase SLT domain-containing protein [Nocardioides jensenii]
MTFPASTRRRFLPPLRSTRRAAASPWRQLSRMAAGAVTVGLVAMAAPALADHEAQSGRKVVRHTVRSGETATELAVKYHAWTAELISLNHLGPSATLQVGDRIQIPVVLAALPKNKRQGVTPSTKKRRVDSNKRRVEKSSPRPGHPSRAKVRRTIVHTARAHDVDPNLALAVSWQESGWQMHHVSSADAIGAMQVLRGTGEWMSLYAGRSLELRRTKDNVLAGVLLLDLLDDMTGRRSHQLGAYYQGLGAVREHGLYSETKDYVRNVTAIKRRLDATGHP